MWPPPECSCRLGVMLRGNSVFNQRLGKTYWPPIRTTRSVRSVCRHSSALLFMRAIMSEESDPGLAYRRTTTTHLEGIYTLRPPSTAQSLPTTTATTPRAPRSMWGEEEREGDDVSVLLTTTTLPKPYLISSWDDTFLPVTTG
jgi:hypothetical protein